MMNPREISMFCDPLNIDAPDRKTYCFLQAQRISVKYNPLNCWLQPPCVSDTAKNTQQTHNKLSPTYENR